MIKEVSNGLIQLKTLLNMYGVTIQSYFNFIENISCIDFTDKQYRDFLCESYRSLLCDIDSYSISDSEKLNAKIRIIEKAEQEKRRSEIINTVGKATTILAGVASVTTMACIGMKEVGKTKRFEAEMMMKAAKSKHISNAVAAGFKAVKGVAEVIKK